MKNKNKGVNLNPRKHWLTACLSFVFFIVLSSGGSTAWALESNDTKENILAAIEKTYTGESFEAGFTQISKLAALDISEEAIGSAAFSHPGKMRWQYHQPDRHEIITNGIVLWIYRPDENQVMQGDAEAFFKSGGGGAFLSDISLVRKNFDIALHSQTKESAELKLVAKKQMADISSIIIRISKVNMLIEKVTTINAYQDTTTFEFFNIQFHDIDPAHFEFKPPKGVSIIDMNE